MDCIHPPCSEMENLVPISEAIDNTAVLTEGSNQTLDFFNLKNRHPIWSTGKIKYTNKNIWTQRITPTAREACKRRSIHGVAVRDLPESHFLHGEQGIAFHYTAALFCSIFLEFAHNLSYSGLFATTRFQQCDILGEYTGMIVDYDTNGVCVD